MEFPISRERLQKYREGEADRVEKKERLQKTVSKICKEIEKQVLTTYAKSYIYAIHPTDKAGWTRPTNFPPLMHSESVSIVPQIRAELGRLFPDCEIIIDPSEEYILIDWS